jgi:2-dehydropantoate 2-reductase
MRIVIVGAGALGGYVGSILSSAGVDVILYDIRDEYVKRVQEEGLTISPAGGQSRKYKPEITSDIEEIEKPDAVIIATKAYHTRAAIEGANSLVSEHTLVCSFQNGAGNLEVLKDVVGRPERIIAMTTAHNFLVESPAHIVFFMGAGGVDMGPMAGVVTDRIKELAEVMKSLKVPVKVHEDGHEVVWNKILWNAVLNCTAAVTGMDVIGMVNAPTIHPLLKDIAAEYFLVSEKAGIKVWHPRNFVDLLITAGKAAVMVKTLASPKPSMLQDIEAGRPTEVDYINGAIVATGEKHGVPTPVNKTMVHLVKTIENKQIGNRDYPAFVAEATSAE